MDRPRRWQIFMIWQILDPSPLKNAGVLNGSSQSANCITKIKQSSKGGKIQITVRAELKGSRDYDTQTLLAVHFKKSKSFMRLISPSYNKPSNNSHASSLLPPPVEPNNTACSFIWEYP